MKKIFLVAMMAVFTSTAFAQLMTGKSAAFAKEESNSSNWNYLYMQYNPITLSPDKGSSEAMNGFSFGWNMDIRLADAIPLYLETGIGMQVGIATDLFSDDDTFSMLSVKIPLSVGYMFSIPNTPIDIIPNTGFDFRVNAMGTVSSDNFGDVDVFNKDDMGGSDNTWNRFQADWHIGVNARFWKHLLVGFSYQVGLNEIAEKVKMNQGNLTIGYCF